MDPPFFFGRNYYKPTELERRDFDEELEPLENAADLAGRGHNQLHKHRHHQNLVAIEAEQHETDAIYFVCSTQHF